MKRLTILLMAVCVFAAVGCSNRITNNITGEEKQAMMTITEAGGTPDSNPIAIASFLRTLEYEGVFATEAGSVGYKIKDSKIYFVEKQSQSAELWKEITDNISVSENLNKLEYKNPANGGMLEVLTFDGFGYYSYIQDEGMTKYYQKYDYLDKFEGTWNIAYGNDGNYKQVVISADGCIKRVHRDNTYGCHTTQAVIKENELTFKVNRDRMIFGLNEDGTPNGKATYYQISSGKSYEVNKQ